MNVNEQKRAIVCTLSAKGDAKASFLEEKSRRSGAGGAPSAAPRQLHTVDGDGIFA